MLYKYRGIITAFLGFLLLLLPPVPFHFGLNGYFGILFFLAAFFLRIWARLHIGEHSRGNELVCNEIVKTGPYRYIKHPLYISNLVTGMAFALFHAGFSLTMLGFCVIYGIFLVILAINENKLIKYANPQIQCPRPCIPSLKKSVINDLPTWLWQIAMLILIFLRKNIRPLTLFDNFSIFISPIF
jgi:isoprenylcysteine carboxyl methyltransferase (ICMT) family protein YpbQ